MTDAYVDGCVKTALSFGVKNPLGLLSAARGLLSRGGQIARKKLGANAVDSAIGVGKDFMRARTAMLPMAAVPLVATA